jgi:hypothetical protein
MTGRSNGSFGVGHSAGRESIIAHHKNHGFFAKDLTSLSFKEKVSPSFISRSLKRLCIRLARVMKFSRMG